MNVFSEEYRSEQLRRTEATREMLERMKRLQEQQTADALRDTRREPPRKPSRFDGRDVIDLVQGADGAWRVPPALEARVRAL